MSIKGNKGVKLFPIEGLVNKFEYFFGEDQGRYIVEIDDNKFDLVEKILKESNVFYEIIGKTQKDFFEIYGETKFKVNELYNINTKWYKEYNATTN